MIADVWHARLGRIKTNRMKHMISLNIISRISLSPSSKCEAFVHAKQTKKSFKNVYRDSSLLEIIHSNMCDSNNQPTKGGSKYFITIIDDYSKLYYIYLFRTKYEIFSKFEIYKIEVENQLDKTIKTIKSDQGREYISNELTYFC